MGTQTVPLFVMHAGRELVSQSQTAVSTVVKVSRSNTKTQNMHATKGREKKQPLYYSEHLRENSGGYGVW